MEPQGRHAAVWLAGCDSHRVGRTRRRTAAALHTPQGRGWVGGWAGWVGWVDGWRVGGGTGCLRPCTHVDPRASRAAASTHNTCTYSPTPRDPPPPRPPLPLAPPPSPFQLWRWTGVTTPCLLHAPRTARSLCASSQTPSPYATGRWVGGWVGGRVGAQRVRVGVGGRVGAQRVGVGVGGLCARGAARPPSPPPHALSPSPLPSSPHTLAGRALWRHQLCAVGPHRQAASLLL